VRLQNNSSYDKTIVPKAEIEQNAGIQNKSSQRKG
jgi:hypothetical protein